MSIRTRIEGNARRILVTAAVAGTALAGTVGGITAAHAATNGIIVREQCTGVAGQISYQPGLLSTKAQQVHAVLSATTTGCSDVFNGQLAGSGSFTAVLTGKASLAAENFSGTFTINWPASAGLNPSNGTLTVTESNGTELVSGTVTSGALTGFPISLAYVTTANTGTGTTKHPVTAQSFVNTQSLQLTQNNG
jgi:hypothetical protein